MSGLSLTIVSVCVTGKSCLKTELQFSDMYCLMAAHVYIDLWTETGESSSSFLSLSLHLPAFSLSLCLPAFHSLCLFPSLALGLCV